ncbi:MAG: hypothetical protein HGA53_02295, partial [Anaerolineaceae bacterium]|nr:hypothetical protein [Anaerolineaceae bacterium]
NWVCTMDVGIRAVNWLWGFAYFRHSAALSNEFHILFYRAMLEHGRHIMHNLEYSETLTSNHYLSNVVALVYLGLLLPEFKEAKAWREFGLRELEAEMFKQVYPDGVVFEASTNYHRLTTELFLSATMLAQMNGEKFSPEYIIRLERMIDAISKLTRPNGTTPVIGDQDNGRLHRLKVWGNPIQEWRDFCPLVAAGAAWMQKPVGLLFASSDWAEAFWLAGPEAVRQTQQTARDSASLPTGSVLLPDGGWAVMRDQDRYLMMDVGPVGQNEEGGHTHNDSLSIDVFADGQAWIVDPGTFIYTSDYDARQTFRQTQSHNTVHIPGYEQSQINAKSPFRVEAPSRTRVIHWQTNDIVSMIAAEVQYSGAGILHRRAVLYVSEARAWLIADRIFPEGLDARIHMMFSPGINAEEVETPFHGVHLCNDHGKSFWVCSMQVEKPKITQGWVSNAYGVRQESLQAEFCLTGKSVHYWALLPESGKNDLETRIQTLFKFWEQSNGASYIEKGSV